MDYFGRIDGVAGGTTELVRRGNCDLQAERMARYPMGRARLVGLVTSDFTEFLETWIYFSEIVDRWR